MKIQTYPKNFLAIENNFSSYEDAKIAIMQVPYEHTTTYGKGTKLGATAIIKASAYVEFYDDEYDTELCFDSKIVTMKPVDVFEIYDTEMLDLVKKQCSELLAASKFVVVLGGEHTISIAPIEAHFAKYPNMSVLHFDAHSDLRDEYEISKYSHACVLRRVSEFLPPNHITQVGVRALSKEEREFINANNVNTFFASAIRNGTYNKNNSWKNQVVDTLQKEVYITFDVDVLDPSIMPSTGTPEPGGLLYDEVLDIIRLVIASGRRVVGLDIVELAPIMGLLYPDILSARLLYKILNIIKN